MKTKNAIKTSSHKGLPNWSIWLISIAAMFVMFFVTRFVVESLWPHHHAPEKPISSDSTQSDSNKRVDVLE